MTFHFFCTPNFILYLSAVNFASLRNSMQFILRIIFAKKKKDFVPQSVLHLNWILLQIVSVIDCSYNKTFG